MKRIQLNDEKSSQTIQIDEDITAQLYGLRYSTPKLFIYYISIFLSLGIVYLAARWFPVFRARLVAVRCQLSECQLVLLKLSTGESDIAKVYTNAHIAKGERTRCFMFRYMMFIFHNESFSFVKSSDLKRIEDEFKEGKLPHINTGLNYDQIKLAFQYFGTNLIDIEMKSIPKILVDEILHPFYIFQLFSIGVWIAEEYYYYAVAIFILSFVSITLSLIETRKNLMALRTMAQYACNIDVLRNGEWKEISSTELVPGDIIKLSDDLKIFPCDSILLQGTCLVDESMLTGESIPVSKSPFVVENAHNLETALLNKKFHLYSGTKMIRFKAPLNEPAICMVSNIGFATSKGELVRSILFPKPTSFSFYRDSFLFICVIGALAASGFLYSLYHLLQIKVPPGVIVLRALALITISVPPALPVAMTIGTSIAIENLKKLRIYCISPPRVNVCGKLNIICFDKTGTLTQDGLDVVGVCYVIPTNKLSEPVKNMSDIYPIDQSNPDQPAISHILSSCHSLREIDSNIVGDPIDVKMFMFTGWKMKEEESNKIEGVVDTTLLTQIDKNGNVSGNLRILKCFEFDAALQRMSCLVHDLKSNYMSVHVKGAPETIKKICLPNSIPDNFEKELNKYTSDGFRVLGIASKYVSNFRSVSEYSREEAESGLIFKGFLILENKLKPETNQAIHALKKAAFRSVMVTGDNILTAIAVARECNIIDASSPVYGPSLKDISDDKLRLMNEEDINSTPDIIKNVRFADSEWVCVNSPKPSLGPVGNKKSNSNRIELALTGKDYLLLKSNLSKESFLKILMNCQVFARMSPDLKKSLIEDFQAMGYTVAMCGDGANDCGALRAADVGLSLADTEASVAAPFSSKETNIGSLITLIREGRSALVTSLGCFKYMAIYAIIQTTTVTILYSINSNLSDFQFLYIDLVVILPLAGAMALTDAYGQLVSKRPISNLMSKRVLTSIVGQIFLQCIFQAIVFSVLFLQKWFEPLDPLPDEKNYLCYETTTMFLFSSYQYVSLSVVMSVGKPFRKAIYTNKWMILMLLCLLTINLVLTIGPGKAISDFFVLKEIPSTWKATIVGFALLHFFIAAIFENMLGPAISKLMSRMFRKKKEKKREKKIFKKLENENVIV